MLRFGVRVLAGAVEVCPPVGNSEEAAVNPLKNGGAQRADKARQLDRNAVLGPAGEQAGGFPVLGGGGRGVGDERSGENL